MRQLQGLMGNQLKEGIRSFKLWIILLIFVFFGIVSPALAKLTPVIMEKVLPANAGVQLPEVTAIDAWQQFFKNVGQLGLIVFAILFLQLFWEDIRNGSLILFLTKGVSRVTVIFAKWLYAGIIWTVVYLISFAITFIYTVSLFPSATMDHLMLAIFCLWLFGIFLYMSACCFAMWTESLIGGLIGAGVLWIVGMIMMVFPKVEYYSPASLAAKNIELLTNHEIAGKIGSSITLSIILIVLMGGLTIIKFKKKEW